MPDFDTLGRHSRHSRHSRRLVRGNGSLRGLARWRARSRCGPADLDAPPSRAVSGEDPRISLHHSAMNATLTNSLRLKLSGAGPLLG